jgi:septal ring factor EnvC (AmiA/AmiB activator)
VEEMTVAIKLLLIVCAVFLFAALIFFFLWRLSAGKRKSQKDTIDKLVQQINEAKQTNSELEYTISVLKKNREKANEKINDVHNGDVLGNALDRLHKHKG